MEKKIAGKIYKIFNDKGKDIGICFLEAFEILKNYTVNIQKVIYYFKKLKSEELKLAEVISALELSKDNKEKIEKKILEKFGKNTIVIFEIDNSVLGGFLIKVGDNVIDETIIRKINDIYL